MKARGTEEGRVGGGGLQNIIALEPLSSKVGLEGHENQAEGWI